MKKSKLAVFWSATWPLLIYVLAQNVAVIILMIALAAILSVTLAGDSGMVNIDLIMTELEPMTNKYAIICILLAALVCIPLYYGMIKKDRMKAGETRRNIPMDNKDILVIILSSAALALAANNIISLTPLPIWFSGFEEVNETLDSGGIFLQVITAGIFGCVVEELSLRGVTYLRMKRHWGKRSAMIVSALIFGIYHFNVVQAVYAFFLGLFFAWIYERYDTLCAPIIAHMSANLFVIFLSENTVVTNLFNSLVGFCLLTCISFLIFFYGWNYMKITDPRVELEFVKKEPDTLEKLTEEYNEHENR